MDNATPQAKRVLAVSIVVIVAICIYQLFSAIVTVQTTGIVHFNPSISQAAVSISQTNHEAKLVGTGKTSARLKPGEYQISASAGSDRAVTTIHVSKKQTQTVALKLGEAPRIPSIDDVDFNGLSSFTNSGLSTDQLATLQLDFFRYNPATKKVAIDGNSLVPGPHNRRISTAFTTKFSVTIDSVPYSGLITYSGLEDLSLALYDAQTNKLLFDSANGVGLPSSAAKVENE